MRQISFILLLTKSLQRLSCSVREEPQVQTFGLCAEKPVVRRYHLGDYDWTPLSESHPEYGNGTLRTSSLGGTDERVRRPLGMGRGGKITVTGHKAGQHTLAPRRQERDSPDAM